jgi:uracil-DNA glycosylase
MNPKQSSYYNEGKEGVTVAFVFSCPGYREEVLGRPVAGHSGANLDFVINRLHDKWPGLFKYTDRYDYRITNASDCIYHKGLNNRTEPKDTDVLKRVVELRNELSGIDYVIAFGKKAQMACDKAFEGRPNPPHIIRSVHLSPQAINTMRIDGCIGDVTEKIDCAIEKLIRELKAVGL